MGIIKDFNKIKREQQKEEKISNLIERGKKIIFPERHGEWEDCVKNSVVNPKEQAKIETALKIMELLEEDYPINECELILNNQENSTVYIKYMVFNFSNRGPEFIEEITKGEIPLEYQELLASKKIENLLLGKLHTQKTKKKTCQIYNFNDIVKNK